MCIRDRSDNAPEDDQGGLRGDSDSFDSGSDYLDPRAADPVQDQQTLNNSTRDESSDADTHSAGSNEYEIYNVAYRLVYKAIYFYLSDI